MVVKDQQVSFTGGSSLKEIWRVVDFSGALLLVVAISIQLVGLSLGGNELPWSSPWVIGSLVGSVLLLCLFLWVEATTTAIPVIPLRMLKGRLPVFTQLSNVCAGLSAYAVSSDEARAFCLKANSPIHVVSFSTPIVFPNRLARLCDHRRS